MASVLKNIFSETELRYVNRLPDVVSAKDKLEKYSSGVVYFTIPATEAIRSVLQSRLGIDLSGKTDIPMRWIVGDTAEHTDVGPSNFQHTYLVYMTESPGEFILGDESYPIAANTAFVFNEGVEHKTQSTGSVPRLLVGPMNELAQPVGIPPINYYPTQSDALAQTNSYGYSVNFTVGNSGPFGGYTHWRIASNSTGSSSQSVVYNNGDSLNGDGYYFMYPGVPCFLEGTHILALVDGAETYVAVESLKKGDLVKTSRDGYKAVEMIRKGEIANPGNPERIENRLYKCSTAKYSELTQDLFLTGCHSILVDHLTDVQRAETTKHLGKIFVTDRKYRLIACVDERAEPWVSEGTYTIYHFALENADDGMNYGVYANGGLLVETCAIRTLKNRTNMTLVA